MTSRAVSTSTIPARGARTTRGRIWTLLHSESFATRNEAMSREWHLKRERAFRKKLAMTMPQAKTKTRVAK